MLDAALCCADDITAQALLQLNCEVTKFVFEKSSRLFLPAACASPGIFEVDDFRDDSEKHNDCETSAPMRRKFGSVLLGNRVDSICS